MSDTDIAIADPVNQPDDHDVDERHDDEAPKRSQATLILELAHRAGIELWHSPEGEAYATIPNGSHREHHVVTGKHFRGWLANLCFEATKRAPASQALRDAIATLGGEAIFQGHVHEIHVRVAGDAGRIYHDLADADWRAIELSADGWRLVADPPVRFTRSRYALPMVEAHREGDLDDLRQLVNLQDERDLQLFIGCLVGTFNPDGPKAILALTGGQGSAKSVTARTYRRLVDPHAALLGAEPRSVDDLMVTAKTSWVIGIDNISHVTPLLSDALCRVSTGGGLSKRTLFSDADDYVLTAMRPIVMTSIVDVCSRGDLSERTVHIGMPPISDDRRVTESDLEDAFGRLAPGIVGQIYDAVVCALRSQGHLRHRAWPRLADFARFVTAAEPALGWPDGSFVNVYKAARQSVIASRLSEDAAVIALLKLPRPWEGTAEDLAARLAPAGRTPRNWPESPRAWSSVLHRTQPDLATQGIVITRYREAGTGRRVIVIEDAETSSQSSQSSQPNESGPESVTEPVTMNLGLR